MSGRFCVLAALAAVVFAAYAPVSRATAATAASACSHLTVAASSHRTSGSRSLSSAQTTKLHHFCAKAKTLSVKVKIIKRHRLWIAPRFKYWWHVPDKKWRRVVHKNRTKVRHLQRDLAWVSGKIEKLAPPPLVLGDIAAWSCIHTGWKGNIHVGHGEGGWTSNTGNKYYGGLQMDMGFMSTYGPPALGFSSPEAMFAAIGTADKWTADQQMAVAEYARSHGRGYHPWPETAAKCGLI